MGKHLLTTVAAVLAAVTLAGCTPATVKLSDMPSAVVATVPLTDFGTGIAITPDGTRAYVAGGSKVFVVDTATNRVASSIELGDMPYAIAISPDGQRAYAADLMQREVWFIDTTTGAKQQRALDFHPGSLVAGRDGRLVWVAGCRGLCSDGALHAIDPADPGHAQRLVLPTVPGDVAISPDGARVYVTNGLAASLAVADTAAGQIVTNVKVGAEPLGVAPSPDGKLVYVTNFQAGTMSVLDAATNEVMETLNVGATPRAVAVTPDGRRAYVTHSSSRVSVVDLTTTAD